MKKLLLSSVAAFIFLLQTINAQVSTYSFSSSAGTFTEITGGTLLLNGTSPMDSWISAPQTIPAFTFNGIVFTTAYANANGFLVLGDSLPQYYQSEGLNNPTGSGFSISPFGGDLDKANSNASSEIRWETIANEVVFQWKGVKRYGSNISENFDFQARLNTLNGVIKFVYRLNAGPAGAIVYFPQVGIRTSATDYKNITIATGSENWDAPLPGTAISNNCRFSATAPQKNFTTGLTYTWTPPTCLQPHNIIFSGLTHNAVNFSWTPPVTGSLAAYEWKVVPAGTGIGGTAVSTGTETHPDVTALVTGLTPFTGYDVYLRTYCGGTDYSGWAGPFSFFTPCLANNLPFFEGFETNYTDQAEIENCWKQISESGPYAWTANQSYTSNNLTPRTGNFNAYLLYYNDDWMIKGFNLTGGKYYTFEMYARQDYANPSDATIKVCYGSGLLPADMTHVIVPLTGITNGGYQLLSGVFSPQATGIYYIGIKGSINMNSTVLVIDDISLAESPSCLGVLPSGLSVSNIGLHNADLSWTEPDSATQWQIQYGQAGFTTGTGTVVSVNNNPSCTISGLNAGTSYDIYIRSICSPGDTSTWKGPVNFSSLCDTATVPYSQDFETSVVPNMPLCTGIQNAGSGNNWAAANNPGSGFSSKTLVYEYDPDYAANAWFFTKALNLTAGTFYRLTFRYGNNETSYVEKLKVAYGTAANNTSMSHLLLDFPNINQAAAQDAVIDFTPAASGIYYLGFNACSAADQDELYVDDILLTLSPTCPGVLANSFTASNATLNSVVLNWTEYGPATHWQVEYGYSGFAQGSGTLALINTAAPYTLTGLQPSQVYQIYIRSLCAPGDTSMWSGPVSFATLCDTADVPYNQDFETAMVPNIPLCTSIQNAGTGENWFVSNDPGSGFTSNTLQYSWHTTNSANAWFYTAAINLTGGTTYMLSFRYGNNSASSTEKLKVAYGTAAINTAMTNILLDFPNINQHIPQYGMASFTPAVTGVYYIGFNCYSNPDQWNLFVDDILVEVLPTCPGTSVFSASNTTAYTVDLNWTEYGTATHWQIEYGPSGFAHGAGSYVLINAAAPYTLTGLQQTTAYQAYIRSVCGPGDTSSWKGPVSFTTLCGINSVFPYTEHFSGVNFPPDCWLRATGLLDVNSVLSYSSFGWSSGNFGNVTAPVNKSAGITVSGNFTKYWLISPSIDLGTTTDYVLSFRLALTKNMQSAPPDTTGTDDKFAVVISADNGATWSTANVIRQWDNAGSAYVYNHISLTGETVLLDLSSYTGVVKIAFYVESSISNALNELFVDNFTLADSCPQPSNLGIANWGTTFADLSWSAGGAENLWEIEWDTAGFVPGTGNLLTTSDNPYTLQGLDENTYYNYYVRAVCDSAAQLTSNQAGPCAFNTFSVGTEHHEEVSEVSLFPNPNAGLLNIVFSEAAETVSVTVYNTQGQEVYNDIAKGVFKGMQKVVNLTGLSKGIYLVRVKDEKHIANRKLVIQ